MILNDSASPVVTYCAFASLSYTGTGNIVINDDPFVNTSGRDLHLKPSVLCIDAGDNSAPELPDTDIDGDDRIINDIVDMGADEFAG